MATTEQEEPGLPSAQVESSLPMVAGADVEETATPPPRRLNLRLALGALALMVFSFWLGARLGPLTLMGGNGLSQGTWLPTPAPAEAYIGGAVVHPGLYALAPNARLAGLLRRAGGPAPNADLTRLNLAAPVHDGETLTVPRRHGTGHGAQTCQ